MGEISQKKFEKHIKTRVPSPNIKNPFVSIKTLLSPENFPEQHSKFSAKFITGGFIG